MIPPFEDSYTWPCHFIGCQQLSLQNVDSSEGLILAGRAAAPSMEEPEDIISAYTDEQALEDGVLVEVQGGKVNRVTRAVFDHFSQPLLHTPVGSLITDFTGVVKVIEFLLKLQADAYGWRAPVRTKARNYGWSRTRLED